MQVVQVEDVEQGGRRLQVGHRLEGALREPVELGGIDVRRVRRDPTVLADEGVAELRGGDHRVGERDGVVGADVPQRQLRQRLVVQRLVLAPLPPHVVVTGERRLADHPHPRSTGPGPLLHEVPQEPHRGHGATEDRRPIHPLQPRVHADRRFEGEVVRLGADQRDVLARGQSLLDHRVRRGHQRLLVGEEQRLVPVRALLIRRHPCPPPLRGVTTPG